MGLISNTWQALRARIGYTGAPDFWSGPSSSLPVIGEEGALTVATAYACIRAISSTIAMIPKGIYQVTDNGRVLAEDHPAHRLISVAPNPYQTAYEFWERMIQASVTYGRQAAVIERDRFSGLPIALHHNPTNKIRLLTVDGTPIVEIDGTPYNYEDVLMISEMGGRSPVALHQETLGMTKRVEKYGAEFFDGGHLLGVLSTDSTLTNDQLSDITRAWAKTEKKGVKVLPAGFKYQPISLPPEQTQFLTTRRYQDETICTIFGVPPRVVGVNTQDTKTNGEEQARNFAQRTILPRTEAIRQEIARKLLPEFERTKYVPVFDLREMTRGDMKTRAEYISTLLRDGVMTRNEAREMEGMNRSDLQGADNLILQSNQITLDRIDEFSAKISTP
jgi:HK97 family phage portal protein